MEIIRLEDEHSPYFESVYDWNYRWWGVRDGVSPAALAGVLPFCAVDVILRFFFSVRTEAGHSLLQMTGT